MEYERYRRELLNEPSSVERQFLEAIKDIKLIEKAKKRGHKDE